MRNLTIAPLGGHSTKIAGIIITAISLVLLLAVKLHGPFTFLPKPAPDQQFDFLFIAFVAGMHLMAFSKEKNDDERVHALRAKALQTAFMVMIGTIIAISMNTVVHKEQFSGIFLCAIAAFGLGIYLITFHIGLYFDPEVLYNDDTVVPNIRKNKRFFVIYTILAIIFFALVILIKKA
jgi:hypothetical protein